MQPINRQNRAASILTVCGIALLVTACSDDLKRASTDPDVQDPMSSESEMEGTTKRSEETPTQVDDVDFVNVTRTEYCQGDGPPVIVGDTGNGQEAVCTGRLAQTTFRFGICVCDDLVVGNSVETDAFDSEENAEFNKKGGAVGVNGKFDVGNSADIGGSLWVAGDEGVEVGLELLVGNEIKSNGVVSAVFLNVSGDVTAGGMSGTDATVGGTVSVPAGSIHVDSTTFGDQRELDETIAPPCDCEDTFDISAFAANHRENNHNDDIGLDRAILGTDDTSIAFELPCGVFYIDGGSVQNSLEITVTGRTALFVGGDLVSGNSIDVIVADGAEFDLFVEGNLTVGNSLSLGELDRPAAARLYVGGTIVDLGNGGDFAGNIYAPTAEIIVGNSTEIYGSVFANKVDSGNALTVHYDEAILRAGEACEGGDGSASGGNDESPSGGGSDGEGTCDTCGDCGNQACNDGQCGACETDSDCCAPLQCYQGGCYLIVD